MSDSTSGVPAGMYPDPENPSQSRYWDGAAWGAVRSVAPPTPTITPTPDAIEQEPDTKAGWYPDPNEPGSQRYWDGLGWGPSAPEPMNLSDTVVSQKPGAKRWIFAVVGALAIAVVAGGLTWGLSTRSSNASNASAPIAPSVPAQPATTTITGLVVSSRPRLDLGIKPNSSEFCSGFDGAVNVLDENGTVLGVTQLPKSGKNTLESGAREVCTQTYSVTVPQRTFLTVEFPPFKGETGNGSWRQTFEAGQVTSVFAPDIAISLCIQQEILNNPCPIVQ